MIKFLLRLALAVGLGVGIYAMGYNRAAGDVTYRYQRAKLIASIGCLQMLEISDDQIVALFGRKPTEAQLDFYYEALFLRCVMETLPELEKEGNNA